MAAGTRAMEGKSNPGVSGHHDLTTFHHVPLRALIFAVITKSASDETVGVIRDLHI